MESKDSASNAMVGQLTRQKANVLRGRDGNAEHGCYRKWTSHGSIRRQSALAVQPWLRLVPLEPISMISDTF